MSRSSTRSRRRTALRSITDRPTETPSGQVAERALVHHLEVADDARQRSPQLVRHRRDERVLGPVELAEALHRLALLLERADLHQRRHQVVGQARADGELARLPASRHHRLHDHPADDLVAHGDRHARPSTGRPWPRRSPSRASRPSRGSSSTWSICSGSCCCAASISRAVSGSGRSTNELARGSRGHVVGLAPGALHRGVAVGVDRQHVAPVDADRPPDGLGRTVDQLARRRGPRCRAWCSSLTTAGWSGWSSRSAWTERISRTES